MMSFDELKKAGSELVTAATTSIQRGVKIAEVCSTKDNDSMPVYALNELVQACNKQPEDARHIADALLRNVASSNPVVKYKALRAIKYICQNASTPLFRKCCGGVAAAPIRDAQTWTGPPHPHLGNSLNMRVRDAAKETLEEVFKVVQPTAAAQAPVLPASGQGHLRGRIQGYGSTTGMRIVDSYASQLGTSGEGGGSGVSTGKYGGFGSADVRAAEAAGGSWRSAAQGVSGPQASQRFSTAGNSAVGGAAEPAAASMSGSEAAVVDALCAGASGLRPQPSPEQLRTFLQQAAHLDAETLALVLSQQLVNPAWQTRVRALAAIQAAAEAVSASGGDHPLAMAVATLASMPEAFDSVLAHANPAVRQAARSCAAALGFPASGGSERAATAPPTQTADAMGDLLGGMQEAPAGNETNGVEASAPLGDLLGGDALSDAPAANGGGDGGGDLLGGLDIPAAPERARVHGAQAGEPAQAPAPVADMFAGLNLSSSSPAQPQLQGLDLFEVSPGATPAPTMSAATHATASNGDARSSNGVPHVAPLLGSNPPPQYATAQPPQPQVTGMPGMSATSMPAYQAQGVAPCMQIPQHASAHPSGAQYAMPGGSVSGCVTVAPAGQWVQAPAAQLVHSFAGSGRAMGKAPAKPKDAFDFVNDAM